MDYRKLRIAWSVTWGVLAMLLCVLWVRSYWRFDVGGVISNTALAQVTSERGRLALMLASNASGLPTTPLLFDSVATQPGYTLLDSDWRFERMRPSGFFIIVPSWLPTTVLLVIASLPWVIYRFSLRTLLIATTLIALLLGAIVDATK